MTIELNDEGRIVFSPFLKPYTSYPFDTAEAQEAFCRSVQSEFDRMQFSHPKHFANLLVKAVNTSCKPWEIWPTEAKENPDQWFKLVIGCSWASARQTVIGQAGEEGREWCAVIDRALQEWEAEHRTESEAAVDRDRDDKGRFIQAPVTPGDGRDRDDDTSRGMRRRLQKRAIAGDDQAQAIVAKLASGELSPNAAAIAAGMREKYIRISPSPSKAAKSLVAKQSRRWCLQLLDELSALVFED
jgi:hypothetical protein